MSHVGQRIAAERKLAGLDQRRLARQASYSLSMLKAVEQGREPASQGFISAVAKALRIEPEQLTGAPYRDDEPSALEGLDELRAILAEGVYAAPVPPPADLAELDAELNEAHRLYHSDRTRQSLARLPALIRQLHGALHEATADAQGRILSRLSAAYLLAEWICRRLGYTALTLPALDLLDNYAARADDGNYVAMSAISRARVLMHYGSNAVADRLVAHALDTEPVPAVAGFGHLCAAINAARSLDHDTATEHVAAARQLATETGETKVYGTDFGPANVAIHSCAVELESGDPHRAAADGTALVLPATVVTPPRAGHHWQDNARAWLLVGRTDRSLAALNKARLVAPQQTRLHPGVRETLHGIAAAEKRRTETLSGFAHWLGASL
ncbi:helix-turn-helix domain-containing protein [Nocardia asiatica]|uniref:helix-turn-helix domain-containing protein n=1 Tax=Nocardia asiatica TaxID=209252 RepID=UPI0024585B4E|nr:helix-turn-helix domain-containing protein [Nocardia asiatica]